MGRFQVPTLRNVESGLIRILSKRMATMDTLKA
jgi:hypothetical protein